MGAKPAYRLRQNGSLHRLLVAQGIVLFVAGVYLGIDQAVPLFLSLLIAIPGLAMVALALAFRRLEIDGHDEHLEIGFGPLRVWKRRLIPYAAIRHVEWGDLREKPQTRVHYFPLRLGLFANVGGAIGGPFITIREERRTTRVAIRDAQALTEFLRQRSQHAA